MKITHLVAAALLAWASMAAAQPGTGPMMGGGGMGMHGIHMGPDNTMGWGMMTREERAEHQKKMAAMKTPEECTAYMAEHRQQMEARAKAKGMTLHAPRHDACAMMFPKK